jgi:hypothetical protein
MARRLVLMTALLLTLPAPSALGAAVPPPAAGEASLEGYFLLTGRVTSAVNVAGERVGQTLRRSWAFVPLCSVGVCSEVRLIRSGGRGGTLVLVRRAPMVYVGTGSFAAPVRCAGRRFPRGQTVPFSITVRIVAAAPATTGIVATAIRATYTNPSRINHTPCVAIPGREAATYEVRPPTLS